MSMATLYVLYGSATGTAQDVAEQIGRMASARLVPTVISAMDDFAIETLPNLTHVVFVVATTGDGEAPENMTQSWKLLLRKSLGSDSLSNVHTAVFGLGDSSYAKYNAVARRLQARLVQLGASEIIDRGLGDDQHELGYHGALNPWLEKLWSKLLATFNHLPVNFVVDDSPKMIAPKYKVSITNVKSPPCPHTFYAPPKSVLPQLNGQLIMAKLVKNDRLTAEDWTQDVRHVQLEIPSIEYKPGDIALLYPENVDVDGINALLNRLNLDKKTMLVVDRVDGAAHDFPSPMTIEELVRKYLDIFGTPRRSFFERLSLFAIDEEEKEKLLELASPGGADLLSDYCTRERRTFVEVLCDFKSCHVPLEYLLEFIPRLQPRAYSIASSSQMQTKAIELTIGLVEYRTPYKRLKRGICSQYLTSLTHGAILPVWIKTGVFSPPPLDKDVILIGPGTGIAVMRALVYSRTQATGKTHLYVGCRHAAKDFLYKDEWKVLVANGTLSSLHTAFSRDQAWKMYVQGKLNETKQLVFQVLSSGGYCLVAGSAKRMPSDVYEAVRDIIADEGRVSLKDAEKFMKSLVRQKRYIVESWA
ncbi:NADPH-dependent diflavin oxidoreductase [Thraustotheca clavata]|uniref:NADPH-dependent diflavin oxidoreductase 1 n=1 Tax=Thraustotheca clavata TaxID=74557 RepID=A0A1V9ZD53_9STRA|nr:NADPH-dependent diflavin oxidoreductase [Thraustotheca clavata]